MGKPKKNFYAVRVGRNPGIFLSWDECQEQVRKFPGAVFKGFATEAEALEFMMAPGTSRGKPVAGPPGSRASLGRGGKLNSIPAVHQERRKKYSKKLKRQKSLLQAQVFQSCVSTIPVVYCDGCCIDNGSKGAKAGVGVFWEERSRHNVSDRLEGKQTNIRAELEAACRAIQSALDQAFVTVEIRTDSTFTIEVATNWSKKWQQNNWKTSGGQDVKNKEDIIRLLDLCQRMTIVWTHVYGHTGVPGNEAADALAKAGAQKEQFS